MVNEKVKQVEKACKCVRKHQSATPTLSNVAKNKPPKLRFLLIQTDNGGRVALCSTAATWMDPGLRPRGCTFPLRMQSFHLESKT